MDIRDFIKSTNVVKHAIRRMCPQSGSTDLNSANLSVFKPITIAYRIHIFLRINSFLAHEIRPVEETNSIFNYGDVIQTYAL